MDLRILKTFETIARLGNFQKAAEELQFAPSTVTLQIQRLEADLGVSLFVREGKRVILTEAGRWLSQEASVLLQSISSLRQTVSDIGVGDAGTIRMAAIEPAASQRLASIVANFCKDRPQVQFTMEVSGSRSIAERVRSGHVDFGICAAPPANFMLTFEPLFEETLGVLLKADHVLASRSSIATHDLAGLTILLKEQSCIYRELSEKTIFQKGMHFHSGIEVGSFQAIGQMVQSGLGVGIVPTYSGLEWRSSLVIKPFSDIDPTVAIGMIYKDKSSLGKATLMLMNAIQSACKL
ncbi:LysR family transcriptional regulator [Paenibacillus allorhizosphaerae]|uniref:HTH-type transcriptional activator CmpR n=1 Tax=Paenibacillus allorhizosphaerae TaxID=2849866 RepID=A0ABM8VA82_9BACL|nr:LysR family transcriptional regulator [Paenibacillus allorhizosphaerae]CAG7614992.1 HTH-type transcriptional activator CmpR [Paenibacillus allorhizosphaerae]